MAPQRGHEKTRVKQPSRHMGRHRDRGSDNGSKSDSDVDGHGHGHEDDKPLHDTRRTKTSLRESVRNDTQKQREAIVNRAHGKMARGKPGKKDAVSPPPSPSPPLRPSRARSTQHARPSRTPRDESPTRSLSPAARPRPHKRQEKPSSMPRSVSPVPPSSFRVSKSKENLRAVGPRQIRRDLEDIREAMGLVADLGSLFVHNAEDQFPDREPVKPQHVSTRVTRQPVARLDQRQAPRQSRQQTHSPVLDDREYAVDKFTKTSRQPQAPVYGRRILEQSPQHRKQHQQQQHYQSFDERHGPQHQPFIVDRLRQDQQQQQQQGKQRQVHKQQNSDFQHSEHGWLDVPRGYGGRAACAEFFDEWHDEQVAAYDDDYQRSHNQLSSRQSIIQDVRHGIPNKAITHQKQPRNAYDQDIAHSHYKQQDLIKPYVQNDYDGHRRQTRAQQENTAKEEARKNVDDEDSDSDDNKEPDDNITEDHDDYQPQRGNNRHSTTTTTTNAQKNKTGRPNDTKEPVRSIDQYHRRLQQSEASDDEMVSDVAHRIRSSAQHEYHSQDDTHNDNDNDDNDDDDQASFIEDSTFYAIPRKRAL